MELKDIQIQILKLTDDHHTENIHPRFRGIEYLTGFTGSQGKTLVFNGLQLCLKDKNIPQLFTDNRYYIQAHKQLQPPWELTYSLETTLMNTLNEVYKTKECFNHFKEIKIKLYTDPTILTLSFQRTLEMIVDNFKEILELKFVEFDFVNAFWKNRPMLPNSLIFEYDLKQAGESTASKLMKIKNDLIDWSNNDLSKFSYPNDSGLRGLFIAELDDIAWLFNLRGSDTEFSPMFQAYAQVDLKETVIFIDSRRDQFDKIKMQLQRNNVVIMDQDKLVIYKFLNEKKKENQIIYADMIKQDIWKILKDQIVGNENLEDQSRQPVKLKQYKSTRNKISLLGEKNSQIKDSVAMVRYLSWLERSLIAGSTITEWEGVLKLEEFKHSMPLQFGKAFDCISASGPNAAMVHYMPSSDETDLIRPDQLQLLDQGSNQLDGTTDITRTVAFLPADKIPKEWKIAQTQVLKGNIALLIQFFERSVPLTEFDRIGNQQLPPDVFQGTVGHGIGHFLSEHEFPPGTWYDFPIRENQVISDEPSLEREGKQGIRIEDDLVCRYVAKEEVRAQMKNTSGRAKHGKYPEQKLKHEYLVMENMTLVPQDLKLVDVDSLDQREIDQINRQSQKVRDVLHPRLWELGDHLAIEQLNTHTQGIGKENTNNNLNFQKKLELIKDIKV